MFIHSHKIMHRGNSGFPGEGSKTRFFRSLNSCVNQFLPLTLRAIHSCESKAEEAHCFALIAANGSEGESEGLLYMGVQAPERLGVSSPPRKVTNMKHTTLLSNRKKWS